MFRLQGQAALVQEGQENHRKFQAFRGVEGHDLDRAGGVILAVATAQIGLLPQEEGVQEGGGGGVEHRHVFQLFQAGEGPPLPLPAGEEGQGFFRLEGLKVPLGRLEKARNSPKLTQKKPGNRRKKPDPQPPAARERSTTAEMVSGRQSHTSWRQVERAAVSAGSRTAWRKASMPRASRRWSRSSRPVTWQGMLSRRRQRSTSWAWRWVRHSTPTSEKERYRSRLRSWPASAIPMPPVMRAISFAMAAAWWRSSSPWRTRTGGPAGAWGSRSRGGAGVVGDHRHSAAQHLGGGAVILHQAQGLQLGEALAELFEAAAVRAPEAVDGLVRVADDEQALPLLAPPADKLQLQGVAVLELIDEQVGEAPPLAGGEVLLHGPEQQVVEVHSAPLGQGGLVGLVEL